MVKKIEDKLNVKEKAIVECKDIEVIEGDKDAPLWIIQTDNKTKIAVDAESYLKLLDTINKLMKLNFEYELEKKLIGDGAIDVDDVKAIVMHQLKNNQNDNIDSIIQKLKIENPNLFFDPDSTPF